MINPILTRKGYVVKFNDGKYHNPNIKSKFGMVRYDEAKIYPSTGHAINAGWGCQDYKIKKAKFIIEEVKITTSGIPILIKDRE